MVLNPPLPGEKIEFPRTQTQHQIRIDFQCGCSYSVTTHYLPIPKFNSHDGIFLSCPKHSKEINDFKKKIK